MPPRVIGAIKAKKMSMKEKRKKLKARWRHQLAIASKKMSYALIAPKSASLGIAQAAFIYHFSSRSRGLLVM
jgi:hypothetical protein